MNDPADHGALASDPIEQQAAAAVDYWIGYANRHLAGCRGTPIQPPRLAFDLRGRGAGLVVYGRRRQPDLIRLNADLLQREPAEMLEQTVPHEVAHVVAYRLFGARIKPHGEQWRAVMAAFGKPAETCHRMPVEPARRLRRYAYRCACPQEVALTSIRHNRAQRGTVYHCRRCGERLHRAR